MLFIFSLPFAASLINSTSFIHPATAAYFGLTLSTSVIAIITSVLIYWQNNFASFRPGIPLLFFTILCLYIQMHYYFIVPASNTRHIYWLFLCLLSVSAFAVFGNGSNLRILFSSIWWIVVAEALYCMAQYSGLLNSGSAYFKVSGTWVNPNVTAMCLAAALPSGLQFFLNANRARKKVFAVSLIIVFTALVLLQCRSAYLGAFAGLFIIAALIPYVSVINPVAFISIQSFF